MMSLCWSSVVRWSTSSPHMALAATEKPTRLFTSEVEDNFVSNMTQQLHLSKETSLSFDASAKSCYQQASFQTSSYPRLPK